MATGSGHHTGVRGQDREQLIGADVVDEPLPTKPNVVDAPAASAPLWAALRTVTAGVPATPFQSEPTVVPAGKVQFTVHAEPAAVPVLRTVTSAWKPPAHDVSVLYVAVQPASVFPPPELVVTLRPADAADTFPAASRARTLNVYAVDAVNPVAVYEVADTVATTEPLRSTSYAVTPTLSVAAVQVSATVFAVTVPAVG